MRNARFAVTRSPSEYVEHTSKQAEGSQQRRLPVRVHPDAERPTKELDADKVAVLVRSMTDEDRRTRKLPPTESIAARRPAKKRPLVVVERYREAKSDRRTSGLLPASRR